MKKMLGLLAIAVSLAVGPAWAGDEFCDDDAGGWNPPTSETSGTDPGGGACEVSLVYTLSMAHSRPDPVTGRLRDIGFSSKLVQELTVAPGEVQIAWGINQAEMGEDTSVVSEARLIEWSFRPTDKAGVERVLALSLRRENGRFAVVADWLVPPKLGWSFATASVVQPQWLDSASIDLGPSETGNFSNLYLKWTPTEAIVGAWVDSRRQELHFPLPSARWRPVRLRNAILQGTPVQDGTLVTLGWPWAFARYWSAPPVDALPGAPDEPGLPAQPPVVGE